MKILKSLIQNIKNNHIVNIKDNIDLKGLDIGNISKLLDNISDKNKINSINTFLFLGWGIHESYILSNYNIYQHSIPESISHIMVLIWRYVGLFIISHDLHHNKNPSMYESFLGRLSLLFYGGFLLEDFSKNHEKHHKFPGKSGKDPDFYDGNVLLWYLKFMIEYINIKQVIIQLLFYNLLSFMNVDDEQMILFWLLPSVLASIQLFFYGTFLVHEKDGIIKNSNLPEWLVTFTSYNFGNHINHHKNPFISWFNLKK